MGIVLERFPEQNRDFVILPIWCGAVVWSH